VDDNRIRRRRAGLRFVFMHRRQIQGAPDIVVCMLSEFTFAPKLSRDFLDTASPDRLEPMIDSDDILLKCPHPDLWAGLI
jgi:hypothetical protein